MDVLVPVDGSECSSRALEFAVEFADRFDARLHVVHFSDSETSATTRILDEARETLDAAAVEDTPELVAAEEIEIRTAARVGDHIVELVASEGYDHVVMGHHGSGAVERAILGSAAETVIRAEAVPVTVVP